MVLRLSTFFADVRGTVLTGLSTASMAAATAADSVLSALGKLQAQNSYQWNTQNDTGRNKLINGSFNIAQRGAGAFTANAAYTADRWVSLHVGDTNSITLAALTDSDRTAIGDESATTTLQAVITGAATAANYSQLSQRTENVRILSNKTVTLSFWAKASAALNLSAYLQQNFGTGGSPSTAVVTAASVFALTTSWAQYTATFTLGSASGKTLGTNNDHGTALFFTFSSGTTNAAAFGVGAQSGTFNLWGCQLEVGTIASPLEARPIALELELCQRFYNTNFLYVAGYAAQNAVTYEQIIFPVQMRAVPTVALGTVTYTAGSTLTNTSVRATDAVFSVTSTTFGGAVAVASTTVTYTADI